MIWNSFLANRMKSFPIIGFLWIYLIFFWVPGSAVGTLPEEKSFQNRSYIDFLLQPQSTVVAAGQPIILNCEIALFSEENVTERKILHPIITWFKDNQKLTRGGILFSRTLLNNGSLRILHAVDTSHSGIYRCDVSYQSYILRSLEAQVTVLELNAVSQFHATSLDSGSYARFNCTTNSEALSVVTWYKDDIFLGSNDVWLLPEKIMHSLRISKNIANRNLISIDSSLKHNQSFFVLPNGVLEIPNVTPADSGTYHCTSKMSSRLRRGMRYSLRVVDNGSARTTNPSCHFVAQPSAMSVITGKISFFYCAVSGLSSAVKWYKNTVEIDFSSTTRFRLFGQSNLLIQNTTLSDQAEYACMIDNSACPSVASAKLTVFESPRFLQEPVSLHFATIGCTVSLHCNVSGYPLPSIRWFKNGAALLDFEFRESVLRKRITDVGDEGIYQCFARNLAGEAQSTFQLVLLNSGNSTQILSNTSQGNSLLHLDKLTSSSALISWDTFGLSSPSSFKILLFDVEAERHSVLTTTERQVTLTELQAGHTVRMSVIPSTSICDGPSSEELTFTVPSSDRITGLVRNLAADSRTSDAIRLEWEPPLGETPSSLNYKVVMEEIGGSNSKEVTTRVTSHNFRRLKKYTTYGFKVAVVDPSTRSVGPFTRQITLETKESAPSQSPTNLQVTSQSSNSVVLSWLSPPIDSFNGMPLGYRIKYKDIRNSRKALFVNARPNTNRHTLTGLRKNTEYSVRIALFNGAGTGPYSRRVNFETLKKERLETSPPGKPIFLKAERTATEITVFWDPPESNIYVREYIIEWGENGPFEEKAKVESRHHSYEIGNLEPSTQYYITLRAGNNAGLGAEVHQPTRTKSFEETAEELFPPLEVHLTVLTATTVNVTWHDSNADVRKQDRYYIVRYKTNIPGEPRVRQVNSTEPNCLIHGLRPHTVYDIAVKVVQGDRKSPWSMKTTATTKESKPGSPPTDLTVVSVEDKPTVVQLNWHPPEKANGKLNGYLIFYTTNPSHDITKWVFEPLLGGEKLSMVIEGLTLDTQYYFKAQARNEQGVGPYSETVQYRTGSFPELDPVTPAPLNMPKWMWYLIIGGVGLVIIIIVMVATIVICRNRRAVKSSTKTRSQSNGVSRQSGSGAASMSSGSWPMHPISQRSVASTRLLNQEDLEMQSLRAMDSRYGGEYPLYRTPNPPTEIIPLNMQNIDPSYSYNYPYPSHQSNVSDLLRSPASSGMSRGYSSKSQYGNSMLPPLQPPLSCEISQYDIEYHCPRSNIPSHQSQDYAGDSAYGSDHQHHHLTNGRPTSRHGRTSSRKNKSNYAETKLSSTRSSPVTDSLDGSRRSFSLTSDEVNSELADVEAFVRDMKAAQDNLASEPSAKTPRH